MPEPVQGKAAGSAHYWFIGECMVELRRAGPGLLAQSFAGDVYNSAVYFERLTGGKATCFVSAVGTDSVSHALLDEAAGHGLDTRHVAHAPERHPGLYWIELDAHGERSFLYWRADSAARAMLDEAHYSSLQSQTGVCALLYFSGISLAILDEERRTRLLALARQVKESGSMVAFDSNYRPALWESREAALHWCNAATSLCTHALMTFEDEQQLHGDADPSQTLHRLLAAGVQDAVVKLGAKGCLVQTAQLKDALSIPALKAEPVDTTAAGDSFNAAYLAARIQGKNSSEAAQAGCQLAARVVGYRGAIIDKAEW
ncbi:sugar kinase [Oxalobacteraceae bacterium R-40]|uniref:Sugar kinase n=1 Tax=Keguizhuia sedimenti TaxID=3064264 RepID=A0ABU1BLV7_9BURK|nr:sugar kinase [Oxalobacteraceae bacterium R-40]